MTEFEAEGLEKKDNSNFQFDAKNDEEIRLSAVATNKNRDLWDIIGVHRPIASFWYQFVLLLIVMVPAILMYSYIFPNFILPFPGALGYQALTIGYFALFFTIMDVATGPAAQRFIAQYAETDPRQALKYIQFFIYFQMFTGIIQVTVVTLYCLYYVIYSDLAYATWFFLIYSLTQFPGMLGAYNSTLAGYQRFDKANIVSIIQGVLFENITQIVFILMGRYVGLHNPAIGELVGATYGFLIGKYIDDFFAMGLSAYYVKKVIEPYGIKLIETLIPTFGWKEAKESLLYGIKLLGASLIATLSDYVTLIMMISWVPNYISIIGYVEVARTIANYVGTRYNFSVFIAQAYNNKKYKLTKYAITRYFIHWWYFAFFLTLEISMMFPPFLKILGGEWGRAAWIIPIYVFPRLLVIPPVMGAEILQACDHPMYRTYGIISEKITKMITVFLLLSPGGLVSIIGAQYYIILYILHDIPAYIVITFVEFYLIHKKIIPVKINLWQTFVAGTLASLPVIPLNKLLLSILDYIQSAYSVIYVILFVVLCLLILLILFPGVLFFFFGLSGGWDDIGLNEFKNAVELSGPSKFIVNAYFKATRLGHNLCPIKNKFSTPSAEAYEEIDQLQIIKESIK
ncbi:MAG: hypothetical protein ACTSU2_03945 [Promethearchaeota archaeon]